MTAIDRSWFARSSLQVAPDLVGCSLVRLADATLVRGLIVEVEAYTPEDPACHAYRRRTSRNAVMFGPPGSTYVYLIYGIYFCLNIVTDQDGVPSAVLIRALLLESLPPWLDPVKAHPLHRVAAGPGKLCRALHIDRSLNAEPLEEGRSLWVEQRTPEFQQQFEHGSIHLTQTTRIGLTQGADLPWRWYLSDCSAVSKK